MAARHGEARRSDDAPRPSACFSGSALGLSDSEARAIGSAMQLARRGDGDGQDHEAEGRQGGEQIDQRL
jgi:hypothetical protein